MRLKRATSLTATTLLIAGAVTLAAVPAQAVPLYYSYGEDLKAAADAADAAFIAGDWDEVRAQLAAFDDAVGLIVDDLGVQLGLIQEADEASQQADEALEDAEDAADAVASKLTALENARSALSAAQADVATKDAGVVAAKALRDSTPTTTLSCPPPTPGVEVVCVPLPNPLWMTYDGAVTLAQGALAVANAQVFAAQVALSNAELAWDSAHGDAVMDALDAARDAADTAALDLENAEAALDDFMEFLSGLEPWGTAAEDRRLDLEDLDYFHETVVWKLGAGAAAHPGATVDIAFSVPNTEYLEISDASVRIIAPTGLSPECDIDGGNVAPGETVTCNVRYEATAADLAAGHVTFEVELSGYLPLGPGNPRAFAATRTLVASTGTFVVPVTALADDAPAGGESELAQTGLDSTGLGALAAVMIAAGGALLIVRRRLDADTL